MYGLPSATEALFSCALECALRRRNRRCKCWFGSRACNLCKYYIKKYIDADPRHVELFMREAEFRAGAIKAMSGDHHFIFGFCIAICLFLAWITYKGEKQIDANLYSLQNSSKTASVSSITYSNPEHINIDATLHKVARDLDKKADVNRDGKTNCIDAAVLFYKYYPDKSKVCIEENVNKKTGMNHLFNCVLVNGVWKAVEPQTYHVNRKSYWMKDVWGSQYDNTKNKDVTENYIKYVK